MKKHVSKVTLALSFLSLAAFAQEGRIQPCNTYAAMEECFAANPAAQKQYEANQQFLNTKYQEYSKSASKSAAAFEYTVPVVFHILYECNGQTVTDATCISALDQVNKDFARMGADTGTIFAPFRALYINSDIKFMLAKRDPAGNCINGIVRHMDAKSKWDQGDAINDSYWTYTWDPTKYLNIYVVADIVPSGTVTGGGIIIGYTYKPGTWPTNNPHDAIVYRMSHLSGNQGTIPNARSLTHEIGHWLNLSHTFGNTNNPGTGCFDDGISDTPITKGNFGGCPASSTNPTVDCGTANVYYRNVENFMNYADCSRNFTTGQTNMMRATLGNPVSGRDNLSTIPNLTAVDIYGSGACMPVAEFHPTNCTYTICSGGSLTLKDFSFNGTVSAVQWTADNGAVIASPTGTLTNISFPNTGTCNVTLSAANSQGTTSITKSFVINDGTAMVSGLYMESFENPGVPMDWSLINVENDAVTWTQTGNAYYDQYQCFMIEGASNLASHVDILEMPMIDLLNNPGVRFEFAYAYRRSTPSQNDQLKIQGSKDCGGSWQDIYTLNAGYMASESGGTSTDEYYPVIEEWATFNVSEDAPNWQNFVISPNVKIRFTFIEGNTGNGNNIFLDAINFYSATGINELTKSVRLNLYPNPSNGSANVSFHLNDPASVKVSVVDILGKEVLPAIENNFQPGEQIITINENQKLSKGVYFVNLSVNGAKMSTKLVIN